MNGKFNLVMVILFCVMLAACAPAASKEAPPVSDEDMAAIYGAVIRQLYTVDHTFGEAPEWPTVYVVMTTNDGIGDPETERFEPVTLSSDLRSAIADSVSGLPTEIVWIESREEAPISQVDGRIDGGDAVIIELGNLHEESGGEVHVPASLVCGSLCSIGKTYIVEQVVGVWQVTGDTGVVWMS